jgi:hypothetical protein
MDGGLNRAGDMISMKAPLVFRTQFFCSLALLGAFAAAPSALAHHSFTMFDMSKRLTLVGTVTSFEWTNPHSYIEIDVPEEQAGANSGGVKHWSIEMGSPSILQQSGWKFSSLRKGDKTTLIINPLKNGKAGGFLSTATLPDGRTLGNGPAQNPQ